jgi:hypothetical protein
MPTIHREAGFRFVIYVDDHPPPHVHVLGEGRAKIVILGPDGLPLPEWGRGIRAADRRRLIEVVSERQEQFLAEWKALHGGGDE